MKVSNSFATVLLAGLTVVAVHAGSQAPTQPPAPTTPAPAAPASALAPRARRSATALSREAADDKDEAPYFLPSSGRQVIPP